VTAADSWSGAGLFFMPRCPDEATCRQFRPMPELRSQGTAWRKVIYGSVGVLAYRQQAAALRSLAATRPWVDSCARGGVGLERRRSDDR